MMEGFLKLFKKMDRRDFLGGLVAYALFRGKLSAEKLEHTIQTVADKGKKTNPLLSEKARTLVKKVIQQDQHPDLKRYDSGYISSIIGSKYQSVKATMIIDGKTYSVWVGNGDGTGGVDFLQIKVKKGDERFYLEDAGLDGNIDHGMDMKDSDLVKGYCAGEEGEEHIQEFQKLYKNTLDILLEFYEK